MAAGVEEAPEAKRLRVAPANGDTDGHLKPPEQCAASIMTAQEAAAVTVTFDEAVERLSAVIEEHGMAIVTDVLGSEDIAKLEDALAEDLRELVDVERVKAAGGSVHSAWQHVAEEGLRSWPEARLMDLGGRGRFQDRGLPHGRFAWQSRLHRRVKRVYEILHCTADLVSSCDNAFVANATQAETTTNKYWPHVDQNDHDTKVPCKDWMVYQGILYVWSSDDSSHRSTTVIWPHSHKLYDVYMGDPSFSCRIMQGKPHFSLISRLDIGERRDRLIRGWDVHSRRVPVPAGALLLFTSRTTHQGWSGGPRLAQPVCWEPRARRDKATQERKLRLAALGFPSTHWASLGMPHELSDLQPPKPQDAVAAEKHDDVRFPLRASIRSQALNASADPDSLWSHLLTPPWFEALPVEAKRLLEASISDEYKAVL